MIKNKLKKKVTPYLEHFRNLKKYLLVAGIKLEPKGVYTLLYVLSAIVDMVILFWLIFLISEYELLFIYIVIVSFLMLTFGYLLIFLVLWLMFLIVVDYLKFKRKLDVEDVLPEFLRLVAANHRAGLPLDLSLWKANRPRFGILAEEINQVAKGTYASGELIGPLEIFGTKYDSPLLKRVISNLVEGLKTGADIATLLDDVSNNVTTIKNTRKELASEVENYMVFITVAVLIISPLMFGLTHKMTGLIETVKDTLAASLGASSEMQIMDSPMDFSTDEGGQDFGYYFDIFVYFMVLTNSVVSVLLMSVVKYGNIKQDLKKIPVYYVICITSYLASKALFAKLLISI